MIKSQIPLMLTSMPLNIKNARTASVLPTHKAIINAVQSNI